MWPKDTKTYGFCPIYAGGAKREFEAEKPSCPEFVGFSACLFAFPGEGFVPKGVPREETWGFVLCFP